MKFIRIVFILVILFLTNIIADNEFLPKLSQNFLEILDDEEYYDITIEVGNNPHVKIFRAHMVILNYRSPYLKRILSTNKKKNDGTLTHIKLPNILPEIFQIILSGKISLIEYDILDIIKILIAANELNIQELIPYLQSFLIENKPYWMKQNFNLIYQTSFENDSFLDLQKFCTEIISKQPEKILHSFDFTSISEKALISLIQHIKVKICEVQIWEHVLKWGIAKNPGLSSDPSSYSNDDFNVLKKALQQFIPLIKFTEFTPKEFLNKVFPYKKIISEEIYEDTIKYFLENSNNKSEPQLIKCSKIIDSKIITIQYAELISKWIDRLEITDELTNSYEFKLIFRGSRDGFTAKRFHEICDNQSRTITIIKVKDSNEILGGYNPTEWKSDYNYGITKDSFIFSFKDDDNIDDYILSRVKDEGHAIYNDDIYGPSFGYEDLIIFGWYYCETSFKKNDLSYCRKKSYEKQIRETEDKFSIEEYEVFQIHDE
uniref:Kelch-like protein 17 n=1 Tax=Rhizophagus irregularis (strain DAOM 181602 / DAOM 197198 / MUCL 43194) TaxID=747089 RepID=U9UMU9_RHIID